MNFIPVKVSNLYIILSILSALFSSAILKFIKYKLMKELVEVYFPKEKDGKLANNFHKSEIKRIKRENYKSKENNAHFRM
jgi:hypothetical protein